MDSSLSSLETKPPPLEEDPERFYRSGENSRGFEKNPDIPRANLFFQLKVQYRLLQIEN